MNALGGLVLEWWEDLIRKRPRPTMKTDKRSTEQILADGEANFRKLIEAGVEKKVTWKRKPRTTPPKSW